MCSQPYLLPTLCTPNFSYSQLYLLLNLLTPNLIFSNFIYYLKPYLLPMLFSPAVISFNVIFCFSYLLSMLFTLDLIYSQFYSVRYLFTFNFSRFYLLYRPYLTPALFFPTMMKIRQNFHSDKIELTRISIYQNSKN